MIKAKKVVLPPLVEQFCNVFSARIPDLFFSDVLTHYTIGKVPASLSIYMDNDIVKYKFAGLVGWNSGDEFTIMLLTNAFGRCGIKKGNYNNFWKVVDEVEKTIKALEAAWRLEDLLGFSYETHLRVVKVKVKGGWRTVWRAQIIELKELSRPSLFVGKDEADLWVECWLNDALIAKIRPEDVLRNEETAIKEFKRGIGMGLLVHS